MIWKEHVMVVLQTTPLFRIFDVAKAKEFYIDFLGFHVDWEHRFDVEFPLYMQVSRGGLLLHLTEHHGDCCPGATLFLRIQGLEEFHRELSARNYAYAKPGIEQTFYGTRCIEVTDPFGNRIRFNEDIKPTSTDSK